MKDIECNHIPIDISGTRICCCRNMNLHPEKFRTYRFRLFYFSSMFEISLFYIVSILIVQESTYLFTETNDIPGNWDYFSLPRSVIRICEVNLFSICFNCLDSTKYFSLVFFSVSVYITVCGMISCLCNSRRSSNKIALF